MNKPAKDCGLDVKDLKGRVLTTEDKIMCKLFYEKGMTKYELHKALEESYKNIMEKIYSMEVKGYLIARPYNGETLYYLTVAGVYELEFRMNYEYFKSLHAYLESYSTDAHDVEAFLRNRFYKLYSEGDWDESTLLEQFVEWARKRDIAVKKLK